MECLQSKTTNLESPENESAEDIKPDPQILDQDHMPTFKEFGLSELRLVTKGFSSDLIVSKSGEKAPNVVFRGKLEGGKIAAIKRFSKKSWSDAQQFVVGISKSRIDDVVQKLIAHGYKVGRMEQLETSVKAKARGEASVIERKLVHVFTPSTTTDNIGPNVVYLIVLKEKGSNEDDEEDDEE